MSMKRRATKLIFQALLIKITVNVSLLLLKKKHTHLKFLHDKSQISRALAEQQDLYVINTNSISKHYIYVEPGRPLVCDEFFSLQDFLLYILESRFFKEISLRSLQIAYHPHIATNSNLRKHLDKCNIDNSETAIKSFLATKISIYFHNNLYLMLDKYIKNRLVEIMNNYIFSNNSIKKEDIFGIWKKGKDVRKYNHDEQTITYALSNGSKKTNISSFSKISSQMISMRVVDKDDIEYEERIFLSEDRNTLVVYQNSTRSIWRRSL